MQIHHVLSKLYSKEIVAMEMVNLPMNNYAQFSFGLYQMCSLTWLTGEINCLVPETLCSSVGCLMPSGFTPVISLMDHT